MTQEAAFDLFGEIPPGATPAVRGRGPKGGKRYTAPAGYIRPPGTGPAGETCGSCAHMCSAPSGRYRKCLLAKSIWTNGPRTDIRSRSPACSQWSGDLPK